MKEKSKSNGTGRRRKISDSRELSERQRDILDDCFCALNVEAYTGKVVDPVKDNRFFNGEYSLKELSAIGGVSFLYKVIQKLYDRVVADTNDKSSQVRYATEQMKANPDLTLIQIARLEGLSVDISNECIEVLNKLNDDETSLELYDRSGNPNDKAFFKLSELREEARKKMLKLNGGIYARYCRKLKEIKERGGTGEADTFKQIIGLQLRGHYEQETMRKTQLQRCIDWMKGEKGAGHAPTICEAARQFGNEINAEVESGGFDNAEALEQALRRIAQDEKQGKCNKWGIVGVAEFLKSGRGRPKGAARQS